MILRFYPEPTNVIIIQVGENIDRPSPTTYVAYKKRESASVMRETEKREGEPRKSGGQSRGRT